ncbi:TKL protein kinase [Phytophthora nicotianae INRA-310]|uniref:TKL protein kinase n=1 Tax=Phytophthora nicotianae (strain INRA-310) TaxID=761204 RepID=W2Q9B6_PHYN3|nr:TKL protein kinase [Phytophthora nicotianae INRA-310]ETN09763.1 TKL protein kinase [Phytophthora nicotianae INRA-310]
MAGASTVLVGVLLLLMPAVVSSSTWVAQEIFDTDNCSSTPVVVSLTESTRCSSRQCMSVEINNDTKFMNSECNITNRFAYAGAVFGEYNYIVVEDYGSVGCENLHLTTVIPVSGSCSESTVYGRYSIVSALFANGSALIALYPHADCEGDAYMNFVLDSGNISSGDCVLDYYKFYTSASEIIDEIDSGSLDTGNNSDDGDSGSRPSLLAILGIVLAAGAVGFMTAIFFWKRRTPRDEQSTEDPDDIVCCERYTSLRTRQKSTAFSTGTKSSYSKDGIKEQHSISYFWDDDEIAAARVDRDKIDFEGVISHGGYGQVMSGWFNGQHVAVKMLLPENRKSMKYLSSFLEEVKLMSMLEHPRIVQFIGVAWDSLSDMCLLTEFMEGGDLRTLLASYEAQDYPVGFNMTKVTIALHIAHALTYLHSLDPPVLHRDLKSKNILLSATLDARLSDFGESREHVDETMTSGVGTSRWMAPEVMMGERYDHKADVFSMGVVLSELDLHALPYSHAVDDNNPSRKIPSTAIVHLVAMGKLRVEFSSVGPMTDLGLSCVAVNPDDRPTAAEALYKLHTVLTTEYDRGSWDE